MPTCQDCGPDCTKLGANLKFIRTLKGNGKISSRAVFKTFSAIDRADFIPAEYRDQAYLDAPIPLGYGSFASQVSTIAFMLEKSAVKPGQKILEIGAGSGYLTALLANLVGPGGKVFSIEYVPELKEFAQRNVQKYGFDNVYLSVGDGKEGLPDQAPFNRIISSAEAGQIPTAWKDQLAAGGIILTPFDSGIVKLTKGSNADFTQERFPNFSFVQLK